MQVTGPRQSGKTTLVRILEQEEDYPYFDLQIDKNLKLIRDDPFAFLEAYPKAIIDEAQVYPQLTGTLLPVVDGRGGVSGQYILAASYNITLSPLSKDTLAGRIGTVELLPLTQAEILGTKPVFLEEIFREKIMFKPAIMPNVDEIIGKILTGGYPKLLQYESKRTQKLWLKEYAESLQGKDIRPYARFRKTHNVTTHLTKLTEFATQKINVANIARELEIDQSTVINRVNLYEELHLIRMVPRFHKKTLGKPSEAQLQFIDSGLFALLKGLNIDILKQDRTNLGCLLETYVYGELAKYCNISNNEFKIYHWRGKRDVEVDFVIERGDGFLVGIEVKASKRPLSPSDFNGLRKMKDYCKERMKNGIILYLGDRQLTMSDGFIQLPVSSLWSGKVDFHIDLFNT